MPTNIYCNRLMFDWLSKKQLARFWDTVYITNVPLCSFSASEVTTIWRYTNVYIIIIIIIISCSKAKICILCILWVWPSLLRRFWSTTDCVVVARYRRLRLRNNGRWSRLTLLSVTQRDSGQYVCHHQLDTDQLTIIVLTTAASPAHTGRLCPFSITCRYQLLLCFRAQNHRLSVSFASVVNK